MTEKKELIWKGMSRNSEESMPLGGGGLGLNVWAEGGELLLYFQQSGNFDELNGFPKQGRLRVIPEQGFSEEDFYQVLDTERGEIRITAGAGRDKQEILIWVNQFDSEFHIEWESVKSRHLKVRYESWRFEDRISPAQNPESSIFGERHDIFAYWGYPHDLVRHRDTVFTDGTDPSGRIFWYHQNDNSDLAFDREMDLEGFTEIKKELYNPQKDLIFGGCLRGDGLVPLKDILSGDYLGTPYRAYSLGSDIPGGKALTKSIISVFCQSGQYPDISSWQENLNRRTEAFGAAFYTASRRKTLEWWRDFWLRSYIEITPSTADERADREVRHVSANYRLFRFMLAFNHGGSFPTKFNGGLVTYDAVLVHNIEDRRDLSYLQRDAVKKDEREMFVEAAEDISLDRPFGPDYRAWGGGSLTPQNQRLLYWPLLKSGDADLMNSQFDWYSDALPAAEARSLLAWGHEGCSFTEQVNNFGIPIGNHFGWDRPESMGPGDQISEPCHYHYSTQLEFAWMILQYHLYTGRNISRWLPFVLSATDFFFAHYLHMAEEEGREAYDERGKLRITPATALESYKNAVNPQDVVCPLRRIYAYLIDSDLLDGEGKTLIKKRYMTIPAIPKREKDGRRLLAPAESWDRIINVELPQMYAVYPYEFFGVGKKDLQIARDTWHYSCDEIRGQRSYASWHQDGIFAAHLGLQEEAVEILVKKMADSGRRFPAFWGPGHDWVPDHNWGGTGMIQLQDMLLQTDGDRILLFPCWPVKWDVRFKLHAPGNTCISCTLERGIVRDLEVTPESRKKDLEIFL